MRRNVIFTVCENNVSCTFKQQKTGVLVVLSPYLQSALEYSCFCSEHPHPCWDLCIELLLLTLW